MATRWRTGMKLTKSRLDDGSAFVWGTRLPIRAESLRLAYNKTGIRAGDSLTPEKLNGA